MNHLLTGLYFGLSLSIISWIVGIMGGALLQKTTYFERLSHLNFIPGEGLNRVLGIAQFKWIVKNSFFRFLNQSIKVDGKDTDLAAIRHQMTMAENRTLPPMSKHRIFTTAFASVYPHYVRKVETKGRTKQELDEVICWLTGYTPDALATLIDDRRDFETFFGEAPALHPNVSKITGVICGVRIEEIEDPLMKKIRYLDKLVDELAKGRPMAKVLRS